MKLIEAMKQVKDLNRKFDDIVDKIRNNCADLSIETPNYPDQAERVAGWMQAATDLNREIARLKYCIQKTNIQTQVTIELDGKAITKSISEWILRRKELCQEELKIWSCQTDRQLKPIQVQQSNNEVLNVTIRRYYDPIKRDEKMAVLKSEPSLIDGKLEVANAITDLIE